MVLVKHQVPDRVLGVDQNEVGALILHNARARELLQRSQVVVNDGLKVLSPQEFDGSGRFTVKLNFRGVLGRSQKRSRAL